MMLTAITFVVVILLLISLVTGSKTNKSPPGPFGWPFIGNQYLLKNLSRKLGGQHLAFLELSKQYGSDLITLDLGNSKVVIVSGTKPVTTVLKNDEYDGRPWNEFINIRNLGKKSGITMNDGEEWKELRTWMVQTLREFGFGKRKMSEMIKDELVIVLENLKKGGPQRLKPLIAPAVINVLWTMSTGKRICEKARLQYFMDLMERRARAFDMLGGILSTFPWVRYIAPEISGYNLLITLNNELKDFLMETITEHREKYVLGSEMDLIDMFLREMATNKESSSVYTEEQLVMILVDLFLAGCTTTGTNLDFLFLSMVVHQDVQRKLQKEIDSVIPSNRLPDLNDRPKLPYTEAVMAETHRMWPVLPVIGPRRVLRDTILEDYTLPKESTILLNVYSVNMDPNVYPDPHTFNPERFLKNGVYDPPGNSLIFGGGRRRCPGDALARAAMFLLFVGVMQKYSLLPVEGKGPMSVEVNPGLAFSPKAYEILAVPR